MEGEQGWWGGGGGCFHWLKGMGKNIRSPVTLMWCKRGRGGVGWGCIVEGLNARLVLKVPSCG